MPSSRSLSSSTARISACALLALSVTLAARAADDGAPGEPSNLFERIVWKAKELAAAPYEARPEGGIPEALAQLDYDQYRKIRFRGERALWNDETLFEVELFHPGFLYRRPVTIHAVADGRTEEVALDRGMFRYDVELGSDTSLPSDLGFAGFRVHYPVNTPEHKDEVIAFLGASYFRMVGRNQVYGASARGLAVDTALPEGEEFPRFREFWLVRPRPDDDTLTFYALLDSRSVTGAYRFDLDPGAGTELDVKALLFTREPIDRLGIAPLTSMFFYGENRVSHFDDARPEVHDSDGLLVHNGGHEWIWRPLSNPASLRVSSFQARDPQGFGLAQRDRDFDNYLDLESHYERRPGLWVEPRGKGWGRGKVQLVEIPSDEETNDNIVVFWVPDDPVEAGESLRLRYRLSTFARAPAEHGLGRAQRTRVGRGVVPGSDEDVPPGQRRFVVDFAGGALSGLAPAQPVAAEVTTSSGDITDAQAQALPGDRGWRLSFRLVPGDEGPADLHAHLRLRGERLTERWNYVWYPDDVD